LIPHVALHISECLQHTILTFKQIDPSEDIEFHKCYDDYECAKLSLPLDYYNGTYPDERVSIAITKLPAVVPIDDPRYGGPILINPGGPGGPGALFTLMVGKTLQTIVDGEPDPGLKPAELRYFDILGFDPRGIGWTQPAARCMEDPAASWSWTLREATEGILGSSDAALGRLWSMSHAWGASCKESVDAEDGPDIKQYMTTALVSRDMLEIVERHATWVTKTLARRNPDRILDMHKPEEAKLQYWGFSYGTYLGSTFASMFPDRVGRVILDGVVSSYDYNHSLGNGSLTDNEKVMESFYTYCYNSGPEVCPLTTINSTVGDVKDRIGNIIQSLYHNPLPLNSPSGPDILTYSDVKSFIFSAGYAPVASFPVVVSLLAAIEAGQGEILDLLRRGYSYSHVYSCPVNGSTPVVDYADSVPTFAILCSDGIDQTHVTLDEFTEYWKLLESIAPSSGAIWSMLSMRCTAWKIKAVYKFQGEFGGTTSHPILFLSNTADPVTPLRSGRIMHELFPNSGLLVSDNAGHCSIAQPNVCMLLHIKLYFQTGILPPKNTLCVPPLSPFSLNSTDPNSPFYDPSLEGMKIGEIMGIEDLNDRTFKLHSAAWSMSKKIMKEDLFGVEKLIGGSGKGRDMFRIAAGDY
jgi:pimeloyl-ACP methyl ester carboxylesterase